jgi:hypothetical protein
VGEKETGEGRGRECNETTEPALLAVRNFGSRASEYLRVYARASE